MSRTAETTQPIGLRHQQGRTESAVSRSISAKHRHHVKHVDGQRKFIVYDGKRWEYDTGPIVDAIIRQSLEDLFTETDVLSDELSARDAAELLRFVKAECSARGVGGIRKMMPSDPGMNVKAEELDQDPFLFNANSCTIDLRNGQGFPHDPSLMITKLTPLDVVPEAECPTWLKFVDEVFPDAELRDHMQRLCGYFCTGSVREQKLFIFFGPGANGKSVFLETIVAALGEYATAGAPDLLMKKSDAHPTELAALFGHRLVTCMETEEGRQLAEARVKLLTGGDTIAARRMKEDWWNFRPTHKLVLCTNHKPELRGTDNGIRRRLHLVPFVRTFSIEEQDRSLPTKLRAELPGILRWMIRGAIRWQTEGLGQPKLVKDATGDYIESQDIIGSFLAEVCMTGSWAKVRAASLYATYQRWCEAGGEPQVTQRRFGQSISERGFEKRTNNGVWYLGICIRDTTATEGTEGSEPFFS